MLALCILLCYNAVVENSNGGNIMLWYHYVFGAVLIVASVIITIIVLMQEGRSSNLSGVIGGNSESYGSKSKGMTNEKKLERVTKWFIAFFFVLVLAAFLVFLFV